jgi:RHS repeat-associated protein
VAEYSGTQVYTTTYQYDVLGNLRVVTDALGNTTVITYDALSRKVGMRDPDMGAWTYAYDANGNLITQTDALAQTAWFGYDKLNRLIEKRQVSSTGTVLAQYEYDQGTNGIGHRSAITNTNVTTRWSYDVRGRVGIETKAITGITGTFSSLWQYDALDRVTQTRLPNGESVSTPYNAAGQPTGLNVGSQMLVSSATYNALGSPQTIASGNGVQTRYAYFGLDYQAGNIQFFGKLRQVCVTTSNCALGAYTGTLMNLAYGYDNVGNVTSLQDDTNHQKENFAYDPLDRLVSAAPEAIGVTTLNYTQTYAYNAIGNFITKASVTQVYGTTQPHAVRSLSDGSSFQYDANGNMTQRTEMSGTQLVTYQQQWDIDNRLVVVTNTNTGQVTQYFYDADGTRVKRISPQGTTVYVNADYEVTGPSQMVAPPSTLPPTYTHKLYLPIAFCAGCNGIPSLTEPLLNLATARVTYRFNRQQVAVREGVTLTFVYGDHLGSASVTANLSGTKVSEVRYYPFGETRYSSGTTATTKRFTSQEEQIGIGLYDYGARFFDPVIGRFVSADSIVPKPGNPQGLNRYSYTNNRPLNLVDPSGHCGKTPSGQQICDSSSSTASVALVVAPTDLTVDAAKDTCRPPQEQKQPPAEIRPIPKDVTTMLVTNDPGAALTLVGPIAAPLAAHAGMAVVGSATTAIEATNAACADGDCTNEARSITSNADRIIKYTQKSLQHTFSRHASELGFDGNWNTQNATRFEQFLNEHVQSSTTQAIDGTYRGTLQATHYFNPYTRMIVITNPEGVLKTAFQLTEDQIYYLYHTGNVQ